MIEKSAYIFRKAVRDDCCEVERLTVCLAVLIVCREMGNPRTMNDIATALAIKRKDVSKIIRSSYLS